MRSHDKNLKKSVIESETNESNCFNNKNINEEEIGKNLTDFLYYFSYEFDYENQFIETNLPNGKKKYPI